MKNKLKYSFIENGYHLNPLRVKKDTYKVEAYRLWYEGDINKLIAYYKQGKDARAKREATPNQKMNEISNLMTPTFLRLAPTGNHLSIGGLIVPNNFTIYHNPVASVISRAKADLLASTKPIITVSIPNQKRLSESLQELVEKISEANDQEVSFQQEIETASYSGGVAYKPILDPDFSELPLYQTYDKGSFIVNKVYDKAVSVVFIDKFDTEDDGIYTLYSEHGKGYVIYSLINEDAKEVELTTLPETAHLRDLSYVDEENNPLDILLAVYVENKPGFRSDYENSIDDFQALDETYSKMMDFLRKTSASRVVSENSLKTDHEGNAIVPSSYDSNYIVQWDNSAGEAESINQLQALPDVNNPIQGYMNAMEGIYRQISAVSGLSVKTLSGNDSGGANESGQALLVRENQDLKTRENMAVIYGSALKKLFKLLIMLKDPIQLGQQVIKVKTYKDLEVQVEFYNPAQPTFEQVGEEVSFLLDGGLIDLHTALVRLWVETGRKTEVEVEEMLRAIEGERRTFKDFVDSEAEDILNEDEEEDILEEDKEEEEEDIDGDK